MKHIGIVLTERGAAVVHVDHGAGGDLLVTDIERLPSELSIVVDRVAALDEDLPEARFIVDGDGLGGAVWAALGPPTDKKRWTLYTGRGFERQALVNALLVAIVDNLFHFAAGLAEQGAMSKALVSYRRTVKEDGLIGSELVVALLLAVIAPPKPRPPLFVGVAMSDRHVPRGRQPMPD